ncbi:MAG: hypothetical protein H6695_13140 [Deferribacteres bacterium]|nr:hypothetical protein [candidate division KSB1 bacterium]MCB9511130.1 hypothetical protein [Deferribacteres bacterium]
MITPSIQDELYFCHDFFHLLIIPSNYAMPWRIFIPELPVAGHLLPEFLPYIGSIK